MERQRVSTGTEWELRVGYSRAVRIGDGGAGDRVLVSGTTATDDNDDPMHLGDPYRQTVCALDSVEAALVEANAGVDDVVRSRLYVADADDWEAVGRAHGERFGEVRPACTLVEVSRLVEPAFLVEIEVEAIVGAAAVEDDDAILGSSNGG